MIEKKYAFLEVGGKNCTIKHKDLYFPNTCGCFCGITGKSVSDSICSNCTHGNTLDEMAQIGGRALFNRRYPTGDPEAYDKRVEELRKFRAPNENLAEAKEVIAIIKALLGGEDK